MREKGSEDVEVALAFSLFLLDVFRIEKFLDVFEVLDLGVNRVETRETNSIREFDGVDVFLLGVFAELEAALVLHPLLPLLVGHPSRRLHDAAIQVQHHLPRDDEFLHC